MKPKFLWTAIAAVIVAAGLIFFVGRSKTDGASDASRTVVDSEPANDPALMPPTDGSPAFDAPIDRSARWGFVLYDEKLMSEGGAKSQTAEGNLFTGDQVYIGEGDKVHQNQTRVTTFDGKTGWVDGSKIFETTTYAQWNVLDSSTAPLKSWIPEEMVKPENLKAYQVVTSSDFLMRASKNPNAAIAQWAQAVLSGQAESAAQ